jgi:hypothetical protein
MAAAAAVAAVIPVPRVNFDSSEFQGSIATMYPIYYTYIYIYIYKSFRGHVNGLGPMTPCRRRRRRKRARRGGILGRGVEESGERKDVDGAAGEVGGGSGGSLSSLGEEKAETVPMS